MLNRADFLLMRSWGTYWGESGWARVVRGDGDLGMTLRGDWAVPEMPPPARLPDAAVAAFFIEQPASSVS